MAERTKKRTRPAQHGVWELSLIVLIGLVAVVAIVSILGPIGFENGQDVSPREANLRGNAFSKGGDTTTGYLDVVHVDDFENPENSEFQFFLRTPDGSVRLPLDESHLSRANSKIAIQADALAAASQDTPPPYTLIAQSPTPAQENLGEQYVVAIVASTSTTPAPITVAEASHLLFSEAQGTTSADVIRNSYGAAKLTGKVLGPYQFSSEVCDADEMLLASLTLAREGGVDLTQMDRLVILAPCTPCVCYGGLGTIGKMRDYPLPGGGVGNFSVSWDFYPTRYVVGHELGHNWGGHHASRYACFQTSDSNNFTPNTVIPIPHGYDCESYEYGDETDILGGGSNEFSALHRMEFGWLPSTATHTTRSGTYTLSPLNSPLGRQTTKQLLLPLETETNRLAGLQEAYLSIEYRTPSVDDDFRAAGVAFRVVKKPVNGYFTFTQTNIIPLRVAPPYFNVEKYALSVPGETFTEPVNGYVIRLDQIGINGASVTITDTAPSPVALDKPSVAYAMDRLQNGGVMLPPSVPDDGMGWGLRIYNAELSCPMCEGQGCTCSDKVLRFAGDGYATGPGIATELMQDNNAFTISLWIRPEQETSGQWWELFDAGRLASMYLAEEGVTFQSAFSHEELDFLVAELGPHPLPPKGWSHLVGTYDGTTLRFYINGQLVESADESYGHPLTDLRNIVWDPTFHLAGSAYQSGHFVGMMDDVQFYASALSEQDIIDLYQEQHPGGVREK